MQGRQQGKSLAREYLIEYLKAQQIPYKIMDGCLYVLKKDLDNKK